jgi:hypothetical protein
MAAIEVASVPHVSELDDSRRMDGLLEAGGVAADSQDPAACAARVIAVEALSIFEAAEARALEIEARGRRHADDLMDDADEGVARALAHLDSIRRDLEALAAYLDDRLPRRGHDG